MGKALRKPDPDDLDDDDDLDADGPATYRVTASELRGFVSRVERLDAEIADLRDQMKEVYAEARARGYDAKVLRRLVAERKRDRAERQEEEAILELYRQAIGDI